VVGRYPLGTLHAAFRDSALAIEDQRLKINDRGSAIEHKKEEAL
jgi:hypothetical protein